MNPSPTDLSNSGMSASTRGTATRADRASHPQHFAVSAWIIAEGLIIIQTNDGDGP
jgi:hypothetical protein